MSKRLSLDHLLAHYLNTDRVDLLEQIEVDAKNLELENFYSSRVIQYDTNLHLTFEIQGCNELVERQKVIAKLGSLSGKNLLEIGCGSGRDSELLLDRIKNISSRNASNFVVSDLSMPMLEFAEERIRGRHGSCNVRFCRFSADDIPFEDNTFDCIFSFGILSDLPDISTTLREISRVAKSGAVVVLADEGVPYHLRQTDFFKYISFTNPSYGSPIPISMLPDSARGLELSWVNNESFYVLSYVVDKAPITCDIDRRIPGLRGGTLRTRVDGVMEGISPAVRDEFRNKCQQINCGQSEMLEALVDSWLRGQKEDTSD